MEEDKRVRMEKTLNEFFIWRINNDKDFREKVEKIFFPKINVKGLELPQELIKRAMYMTLPPGRGNKCYQV